MVKGGEYMKAKWKNWWWYHWWHVLLAVLAVAVILYSFIPGLLEAKPDSSVAVVSFSGLSDESLTMLEERFRSVAEDTNGDGKILVRISIYQVDLSGAANAANYQEAARLDADLVGKLSSVFLIEDQDGFLNNTAVELEQGIACTELPLFEGMELPEGMVISIRSDCGSQADRELYNRILSGH